MKGILIDPEAKTIQEVEIDGSLHSFYELLGCDIIDRVCYDSKHDLVVDDEGLLKTGGCLFRVMKSDAPESTYWYDGLIAGKAVVVGVDVDPKDGSLHWVDHNLDATKLRVRFLEK